MAGTDRKNEIIQTARKIFAYYGYDKTTLDDIGRMVGLNKTSLYYYYKNKDSIFVDVLQSELDSFLSGTMKKLESVDGYRNKIITYLKELLIYSRNAANLIGLSNENMQSVRPYIRTLSEDFLKKHMHYISKTLEMGVREGEFKECDTELIAMSILKITDAVTSKNSSCFDSDITKEKEDDDTERGMILMVSLVLDGLSII